MSKIRTLIKAPLLTQSGYGVHSRQIFRALVTDPQFDVHVENLKWGNCSFLTEDSAEKRAIKHCMQKFFVAKHNNDSNFDLFIHVTIPNEFERLGKINIGVTAGIETDRISHVWAQKCNEMDLVIVPSKHSQEVIAKTSIEWHNQGNNTRGEFKVTTPVVVCPEGVDTKLYNKLETLYSNKIADLKFDSKFNFLHVGQWGGGGYGEDRKNIALLVKYFIESFRGRKDVGLVLKVNMARSNAGDFTTVENRLKQIKSNFKPEEVPPIYLLHGSLTDEEMANLYNHPQIKAFVSFTHGEGFGLPLLEAAACELPIIATNWSGHLDFLEKKKFSAVDFDMTEIPQSAIWEPILIKGAGWASVREQDAKHRLQKMVSSYFVPTGWAKELGKNIRENYDVETVCQTFGDTVKQLLAAKQEVKGLLNPVEVLGRMIDTPESYNILYTMPMSNGDVFISTAVIDGLMKEIRQQQPDAKLYFATNDQFASILDGNPNVHKVVKWHDFMMNMDVTEAVFDLVLTPNTSTQYTFSNWVRRGEGRLLAEEFANHCQTKLGDYFIKEDSVEGLPEAYITFHPGSGKDKWAARNYLDWKEVILNLKSLYPDLNIIQVGSADEKLYDGVIDYRGKTNVHQLATVLKNSMMHLSIDTFTMHMAAAYNIPTVSIFGCSYANATGPWVKEKEKSKIILLESERKTCGCTKACYKDKPVAGNGFGPINEIDPKMIFQAAQALLKGYENEAN